MAIGERIKRIRNFRKLTQAQLGEAVAYPTCESVSTKSAIAHPRTI